MYSMTITRLLASGKASNTATRLGWLRAAASFASRRNRRAAWLGLSAWRRFTATLRPSTESSATKTTAIPPEPIFSISR